MYSQQYLDLLCSPTFVERLTLGEIYDQLTSIVYGFLKTVFANWPMKQCPHYDASSIVLEASHLRLSGKAMVHNLGCVKESW